jgi:CBS domain-containing protein
MQVSEIMTTDPACCTSATGLREIAQMMIDNDCGDIPVVDGEATRIPIGVITDRDIVCRTIAKGLNPLDLTAENAMSRPCVTVAEDMSLDDCCRIMEEKQIRRVLVVDESGACCGVVALADIARHAEESVAGEIVKEVSEPSAHASAAGR